MMWWDGVAVGSCCVVDAVTGLGGTIVRGTAVVSMDGAFHFVPGTKLLALGFSQTWLRAALCVNVAPVFSIED